MTGSASQAMDVVSVLRKLSSEVECRGGDGSHVFTLPEAGGLLQNAIYTQTQLFEVSIWGGFWRGFGEVLERFWRGILDAQSIKIAVFYKVF